MVCLLAFPYYSESKVDSVFKLLYRLVKIVRGDCWVQTLCELEDCLKVKPRFGRPVNFALIESR